MNNNTVDPIVTAWAWIVREWNTVAWKGIPDYVRIPLGLDSRLGMCHGSLVSQAGAKGINQFVNDMNTKVRSCAN